MYLLGGIRDVVKDNPRVIQFVLNNTISRLPLSPSLGRAEIYVSVYLLLLNIGDKCEDVAVTVSIGWIDVPNPLINITQWSQVLVPLLEHPIVSSGVKMWMCLGVPQVV